MMNESPLPGCAFAIIVILLAFALLILLKL